MNKLWVRLSVAFSSMVLIAVLIVVATGILVGRAADQFEDFQGPLEASGGLIEQLTTHYQTHQGWGDVEPLLIGAQATFGPGPGGSLDFFLVNAERDIIYHPRSRHIGKPVEQVSQIKVLPIQVSDQTVGYLGVAPGHGERKPALWFFKRLAADNSGCWRDIRYCFGVLMSRTLTAPLNRLAESARAIGSRDLSRRVEVKGSDEMIEVAQAFNEMAAGLEQGEQLRRNLIADVAHELRTPLTVLQGNLRAILDEVYPLDQTEVTRLYEQTRLLSRLVNDLHELAQAEARQLPLNLEETNLIKLIQTIGDTFAPIAKAKGVTLHADLPADLSPIRVDAARLAQVLHNLLNNGLRHTPAGGSITVRVKSEPDFIRIEIFDTGEGIPPEHLPHIFDRFYRTDPARSRDKGGAGLGLAIARAIIEAHDGKIIASSQGEGQGSAFTIQLPIAP